MDSTTTVTIISGIVAIITAFFSYRAGIQNTRKEVSKMRHEYENIIRQDLMDSIDKERARIDQLNEQIVRIQREKRDLADAYDTRTLELREKMQKLLDESLSETESLRQSYRVLLADHEKLKLDHVRLQISNKAMQESYDVIEKEHRKLKADYEGVRRDLEKLKEEYAALPKRKDDFINKQ